MTPSIIDYLTAHRIPYRTAPHQRVRTGWVGVDCPRCSPGAGKFRLGFELTSGRAHCWVCGGLPSVDLLSELTGEWPKNIRQELDGLLRRKRVATDDAPRGVYRPPPGVEALGGAHREYLERRGLDPDEIASAWGVGGLGPVGRLKWRLFIPVFDLSRRAVSWTTRSLGGANDRRYFAATPEEEALPLKFQLYGQHLARHTIIVVEGPVDAWTLGPGAVATCGVGYTAAQMGKMAGYPVRAICFDAEPDAQRRARELAAELSVFPGQTDVIELETGKDPNGADVGEVVEIQRRYFSERFDYGCANAGGGVGD